MKLTTYLLFISILQVVASGAYSQSTKLTLDLGETTVEQILSEIENQSEFYFLFNQKLVDIDREVYMQVAEIKIDEVLTRVFNGTNVDYIVLDRQIVLSPSQYLIEAKSMLQANKISGKVTDENNTVLPGVNVIVKGTTIGAITNANGIYDITVPNAEAVLVFSYIGYVTQEITVGAQTTINVTLAEDLTSLEEVVVIGYGEVRRKNVTGAVVSLREDDVTSGAAISSISGMLQGRAAGVEVSSNDGLPGQDLMIVIRGNTSISNSNQPLYVVDGFPLPAGVSIAPEDIESIDILKDAASAAIYGSRASAGVVLITTKKGRAGRTEISLDGYIGTQSISGTVDYLDWDENARIVNEQYAQGPNDGNPWYSAEDLALPNNTNWLDEVTRQARIQSYTLRASGGDANSNFSLSSTYFNQEGIFLNSEFERLSLRLNADRKFGKKTKVGMNIYTSRIDNGGMDRRPGSRLTAPLYATLGSSPGRAAYNDDGTLASTSFSRDTRPWVNPIGHFTERVINYNEWRTYANLFIDHNILDNLVARVNVGFNHTAGTDAAYEPAPYSNGIFSRGWIDDSKYSNYLIEGTLKYDFNFSSEDHALGLLAGASNQYDIASYNGLFGSDFPTDKTLYHNLGSASNQSISSSQYDRRIISFFGRANYSFKGKILVTATLRGDGATQFGENDKWGTFPSVSAAWRLSDEAFLSGSSWVNNLKVRASYGVTGNNGFSPYTSLARVGASNNYTFDGSGIASGLGPDGIFAPNPDLRWETTGMLNLGVDFGLFTHRLYGSIEVYNSNTEDLIIDKPISFPSTGYTKIRANVGAMTNKGIELTLGGRIITRGNFKWTADLNYSKNVNEIIQLDGDNPIVIMIPRQPYGEIGEHAFREIVAGGRIGDFFGYTYRGVLQPGEVYAPQPNTTAVGSALYEDINNDGIINSDDRSVIGNANPDFMLGFRNHFEFKGLYLDMFWQGVFGNDIFNFKAIAADRTLSSKALDRYSPTNTEGTRPGVDYFAHEYGSYVNTEFIEDGSYIRLKDISIGYTLSLEKVSWMKSINIYVQGQNLLTFTDYTGFDPEVSFNYSGTQGSVNRGVDDYGFPNYKTYTVGLKVTF
ncbi:MAG: TonB-dependent receptor [Bacteroidales bacterium]|nr:TonB-dependent receptor [Bacteroidales bacterium]